MLITSTLWKSLGITIIALTTGSVSVVHAGSTTSSGGKAGAQTPAGSGTTSNAISVFTYTTYDNADPNKAKLKTYTLRCNAAFVHKNPHDNVLLVNPKSSSSTFSVCKSSQAGVCEKGGDKKLCADRYKGYGYRLKGEGSGSVFVRSAKPIMIMNILGFTSLSDRRSGIRDKEVLANCWVCGSEHKSSTSAASCLNGNHKPTSVNKASSSSSSSLSTRDSSTDIQGCTFDSENIDYHCDASIVDFWNLSLDLDTMNQLYWYN
ncbi:hypothetical protein HDU76_008555, partial [Blyttiomyces sp. JEL0837]